MIPRRQLGLIVVIETAFLAALAAWVLFRLDQLLEPTSLLIALVIVVTGDLVTVLLMQRFAPTRITFAAGEVEQTLGRALEGFGTKTRGRVLIRGERWTAHRSGLRRIDPGDRVRVVSRGGLTLLVERADQEPEGAL